MVSSTIGNIMKHSILQTHLDLFSEKPRLVNIVISATLCCWFTIAYILSTAVPVLVVFQLAWTFKNIAKGNHIIKLANYAFGIKFRIFNFILLTAWFILLQSVIPNSINLYFMEYVQFTQSILYLTILTVCLPTMISQNN